jgi:hypothetical protein
MKTFCRRFHFTPFCLIALSSTFALSVAVHAQDATKDVVGHDHPLLKRYEGSFIVAYSEKQYDQYKLILGKALNPSLESRSRRSNRSKARLRASLISLRKDGRSWRSFAITSRS